MGLERVDCSIVCSVHTLHSCLSLPSCSARITFRHPRKCLGNGICLASTAPDHHPHHRLSAWSKQSLRFLLPHSVVDSGRRWLCLCCWLPTLSHCCFPITSPDANTASNRPSGRRRSLSKRLTKRARPVNACLSNNVTTLRMRTPSAPL
jgi:hypothetical protein